MRRPTGDQVLGSTSGIGGWGGGGGGWGEPSETPRPASKGKTYSGRGNSRNDFHKMSIAIFNTNILWKKKQHPYIWLKSSDIAEDVYRCSLM